MQLLRKPLVRQRQRRIVPTTVRRRVRTTKNPGMTLDPTTIKRNPVTVKKAPIKKSKSQTGSEDGTGSGDDSPTGTDGTGTEGSGSGGSEDGSDKD